MLNQFENELNQLNDVALSAPWSLEELQWSSSPVLPEYMNRTSVQEWVSQLYHIEMFAIESCELALREVSQASARQFLEAQIREERKHATGYWRYADKLGGLLPVDGRLWKVFDHIRAWKGHFLARIFAVNVVLEGDGLEQEHRKLSDLLCPLFSALNRRIMQDEQRHHTFGMMMLEWLYPTLSPHERRTMKDWTQQLSNLWQEARGSRVPAQADEVLAHERPSRQFVKQTSAHVAVPL